MDDSQPQPTTPPTSPEYKSTPSPKNSWGGLIGIIVIILLLIVGGLYFWGAKLSEEEAFTDTAAQDAATNQELTQ
ncbi:MAG: hypothetical protein Q7R88_02950 [bacterium]|nr:hypothetical protein [bacterium]